MKPMYYGDCTPAYARSVIKEIANRMDGDFTALMVIRQFLNNELSTEEIADLF